jgi:hypothetical protein
MFDSIGKPGRNLTFPLLSLRQGERKLSKSRSHENGLVHVVFVYTVYTGPVVVRLAEKVIYREREHGLHAERSSRVIKLLR